MKQKLNKKLVKRLPDVIVINDGTEEQLRALIKSVTNLVPSTFKNKFYEIAKHCVTSYNTVNCGLSKKGAEVISVKEFFKPAKVKLKDVDKPIWFPDAKKVFKYTKDVEFYGKLIVSNTPFFEDDYIDYKAIKWPKTKSSIEDRLTALEKSNEWVKDLRDRIIKNTTHDTGEVKEPEFEKGGISFSESGKTEITIPESLLKEKEVYVNGIKQEQKDSKESESKIIKVSLKYDDKGEPCNAKLNGVETEIKNLGNATYHIVNPEIKEEPIDWSKPNFLFDEDTNVTVLSVSECMDNSEYFNGYVIKDGNIEPKQYQCQKQFFKTFKGTITV